MVRSEKVNTLEMRIFGICEHSHLCCLCRVCSVSECFVGCDVKGIVCAGPTGISYAHVWSIGLQQV